MQKTKIPWVKNIDGSQGYTLNPMTGCLNCIEGNCGGIFPCYAHLESVGRCHRQDLKGTPVGAHGDPEDSFSPRYHLQRFGQLDVAPKGAGIFVCDRSDWAAPYWPRWCQDRILNAARARPDIRLYLLTKQPQYLSLFSPYPGNCWVGVSSFDTRMSIEACLRLGDIEAGIRYLSVEPMLNSINLPPEFLNICKIGWIIIGSQTKPVKHPRFEHVEYLVNICDRAGIPVFIKPPLSDVMDYHRQEVPTCK